MVKLYQESKVRAIGVSNYDIQDLKELLANFDIVPATNQVEFHPFLYQQNLLEFCERNRIQVEAYSPLTRGERFTHPKLSKIAKKYGKTSAQILIRWSLQHGLIAIPKSMRKEYVKTARSSTSSSNRKIWNFSIHSTRICAQCF
jgi:diketogulonate reductase-like aldo/keto reductase